ncbi:MAG: hypothetical protein ACO2ER_08410, partial [Castellaniella sp.]
MMIDAGEAEVATWMLHFQRRLVKWNVFRRRINAHLQRHGIAEDRLMGPFFVTQSDLTDEDVFVNKLLHYLRDDVVRSTPDILFSGDSLTYGALVSRYRQGQSIFVQEIEFGGTD